MKNTMLFALLSVWALGCGAHPIDCPCLEVRVTGGVNNTPLVDAQIWVIDPVDGDYRSGAAVIAGGLYIGGRACHPGSQEYEVRREGYVSQRFTYGPTTERRCNSSPPFPMVSVQLQPR